MDQYITHYNDSHFTLKVNAADSAIRQFKPYPVIFSGKNTTLEIATPNSLILMRREKKEIHNHFNSKLQPNYNTSHSQTDGKLSNI